MKLLILLLLFSRSLFAQEPIEMVFEGTIDNQHEIIISLQKKDYDTQLWEGFYWYKKYQQKIPVSCFWDTERRLETSLVMDVYLPNGGKEQFIGEMELDGGLQFTGIWFEQFRKRSLPFELALIGELKQETKNKDDRPIDWYSGFVGGICHYLDFQYPLIRNPYHVIGLQRINDQMGRTMEQLRQDALSKASEMRVDCPDIREDTTDFYHISEGTLHLCLVDCEQVTHCKFLNDQYASFTIDASMYCGGGHQNEEKRFFNFHVPTGAPLRLVDLFDGDTCIYEELGTHCYQALAALAAEAEDNYPIDLKKVQYYTQPNAENFEEFTLTEGGVVIHFNYLKLGRTWVNRMNEKVVFNF